MRSVMERIGHIGCTSYMAVVIIAIIITLPLLMV